MDATASTPPAAPAALVAVLLAAGAGERFGGAKQLAELDGRPLLAHALAVAVEHPAIDRVIVVLGARSERVVTAVPDDPRVRTVTCADWSRGPSASLRCGLEAAGGDDVLVLLGDQPRLPAAAIDRVLAAPGPLVRATVAGRPGHPVLLRAPWPSRVASLSDDERRTLLREQATAVEVGDLGGQDDVDRPADLERLRTR